MSAGILFTQSCKIIELGIQQNQSARAGCGDRTRGGGGAALGSPDSHGTRKAPSNHLHIRHHTLRFVGLLLVTRLLPHGSDSAVRAVVDALGLTFLQRLLLPLRPATQVRPATRITTMTGRCSPCLVLRSPLVPTSS